MDITANIGTSLIKQCLAEVVDRFAPQQKAVSLRESVCPALASVAMQLFGSDRRSDRDLNDLVHYAAVFAEPLLSGERDRALVEGGLAFLFCQSSPTEHDFFLIQESNPGIRPSAIDTKRVRDSWAFMSFKRALSANPNIGYTAKSGQNLRLEFRDAIVGAVQHALERWPEFRLAAQAARAKERAGDLNKLQVPTSLGSNNSAVDLSELISETFPDGTMVPFGADFSKTWTLRNVGNVPWIDRSLMRVTPRTPMFPHTAESIPVPKTMPGETVTLSVDVVATRLHGFTEVRFKMIDAEGNFCWPQLYPYGLVLIVEARDMFWIQRRSGLVDVLWQD